MNYVIKVTISFSKYPEKTQVEPEETRNFIISHKCVDAFISKRGHLGGLSKAFMHLCLELLRKEFPYE